MFFKNLFDKDALDMASRAATIGLNLVSGTFVGLAMGYFLDRWLEWTKPWLTIGFLLVGIIAGFKNVWMDVRRIQRSQEGQGAGPHGESSGQPEGQAQPKRPERHDRKDSSQDRD